MNNIKFDMKISPLFTGGLWYEKYDYLENVKINYHIEFDKGEIVSVSAIIFDENKDVIFSKVMYPKWEERKWNDSFWKKAPLYANFDDCSWKRIGVDFNLSGLKNMMVLGCTTSV